MDISVVIITKNEGHIIDKTLQSVQGITNDIIIVDSGSTDNTLDICRQFNTTIIETSWNGYGPTKNKGIEAARHEWILNLDADDNVKYDYCMVPVLVDRSNDKTVIDYFDTRVRIYDHNPTVILRRRRPGDEARVDSSSTGNVYNTGTMFP